MGRPSSARACGERACERTMDTAPAHGDVSRWAGRVQRGRAVSGGLPEFPGGVGISALRVYPWETADGLCGGSPHVHLCCSECYIVVGGTGRLQTLTAAAGLVESPLHTGDVVWFTPGTIHRAVNDGD